MLRSHKEWQMSTTLTIPYAGGDADEQELWGGTVIDRTDVESVLVIAPT